MVVLVSVTSMGFVSVEAVQLRVFDSTNRVGRV